MHHAVKMVGWEINISFQHKNRLYWGQGLGWRFSSARLRMANDTSAYNGVESNQPPQDLFISSRKYIMFFSSCNISVRNDNIHCGA